MAIRCGYTVGRNTGESSLGDQLLKYKPRSLLQEGEESKDSSSSNSYQNPAKETLKSKCISVIVKNFAGYTLLFMRGFQCRRSYVLIFLIMSLYII